MKSLFKIMLLSFFVFSVSTAHAQKRKVLNGKWVKTTKEERKAAVQPEMFNDVAPADFKDYQGSLLVSPTFKAIGMNKFLTKRLDEHYGKPYKIVTFMESMETGDSKLDETEFQYHVSINKMPGATGNDAYIFILTDRKNNKVYYDSAGTNSFSKYLQQLLE